ncbi:MAG: hypothetical protein H0V17_05605 [Deltaproteobacteria bacterium]|nr:hypothetical protein [Deltaproteobacteria bacterium]
MKRISHLLMVAAFAVPMTACGGGDGSSGDDVADDDDAPVDPFDEELANREYDYNAALRIAALRLTGDLPTMAEILEISAPTDNAIKKSLYDARITEYMSRPTFATQMFYFWRDTFRMGDTPAAPEMDTAPALAAQLSSDPNGSYMSLLTQPTGNCPTFDENTGVATPAECPGTGPQAGVLGNPAVMKQFFGNFAFRRVKFVQETFDCVKFPVELDGAPQEIGAASPYTGQWPFASIAGTDNGGRVNFQDTSAVICANCHQTLNHIAPLFANYDEQGVFQATIAVPTPLDGGPLAVISDYYPAGETTGWRFGVVTPDIPSLGAAMAADPDIAKCGVARIWNWALGKTDIVDTLQEVPIETISTHVDAFTADGFKLKNMIFAVYTSDDFTRF